MIVKNDAFFKDVQDIINTQDVTFKIKGSSMWPFFKDGKTSITLTKIQQIKRLEVYLFKYKDQYIIHRLIQIKDDTYIFRGDGLISKEVVDKDSILAHVCGYQTKRYIKTDHWFYKLRVRLYRLLPRRITIKVFK